MLFVVKERNGRETRWMRYLQRNAIVAVTGTGLQNVSPMDRLAPV